MGKENLFIVLLVFLALFLTFGCTQKSKAPATTTLGVVCNPPYIKVGQECCLDEDNNSICDSDEKAETTAETTVASTLETTVKQTTSVEATSASPTSTSTIKSVCTINADCVDPQYGKTFCDGDKVMRQVTKFRCSKPGTTKAKCIGSVSTEKVITCEDPNRCVGGKCVTESGDPIATTSLGCSWTQSSCLTYCDNSCGNRSMDVKSCTYDATECRCSAICEGVATTTTPSSTTTVPGTTTSTPATTSTISVTCTGGYTSTNCDNECDSTCEQCEQYQQTPCYVCARKDCSTLSGGWSNSVSCDGAHEELESHASCSGCYRCNEVCPEDEGGVDYYRLAGCDGDCYSDLCRQVKNAEPQSQYKDCYKCYAPVCGNGVVESGEQCETDADCLGYGYCDIDCGCQPDCPSYCLDQGVDGYQWINDGAAGSPAIGTSAQCSAWASQKLQQISQNCFTSCVASASYTYGGVYSCCCVDWNSLPCQDCPGQNPVCPTEDDCTATL